ncbi:MAG: ATP-dependent DNA ligase [Candidatus Micrarchaeota archaeon]|nr:ATP-dependent DNA ligase [Candidatus Micrarchaeota archaeon]
MSDFGLVAKYLKSIEEENSRLLMTNICAELFKNFADKQSIDKLIYFMQGILRPKFEGIEFGIGDKYIISSTAIAYGYDVSYVNRLYKDLGDLGLVAEKLCEERKQEPLFKKDLSITYVYDTCISLSRITGKGSLDLKLKKFAELLGYATPLEARYLARYPTGHMRLGIGDPTILDAISIVVKSTKELREEIERYYNLTSDLGKVAKVYLSTSDFSNLKSNVEYFSPVRPALAERVSSIEEIFEKQERFGIEFKYDGIRLQIHKRGKEVKIFSRNQENITRMFPDLCSEISSMNIDFVAEGECIGFDIVNKKFLPFQVTVQRKRKYGIQEKVKEVPIYVFMFDILKINDEDLIDKPYWERRMYLEKYFKNYSKLITVSDLYFPRNTDDVKKLFHQAIELGLEGIMSKNLDALYTAGARKFSWIKLKKSYGEFIDTIDCVVVGTFRGTGQRASQEFGGLLCCVYNQEKSRFETIAKVSSGLSELEYEELGKKLSEIKLKKRPKEVFSLLEPDYWVEPKFVVELGFDEITVSDIHTCNMDESSSQKKGYALRFPRLLRIRDDKDKDEVTTVKEIIDLYEIQRKQSRVNH